MDRSSDQEILDEVYRDVSRELSTIITERLEQLLGARATDATHALDLRTEGERMADRIHQEKQRLFVRMDHVIEAKGMDPFTPGDVCQMRSDIAQLNDLCERRSVEIQNLGRELATSTRRVTPSSLQRLLVEQRRQILDLQREVGEHRRTVGKIPPVFLEAAALCESKSEDYGDKDLSRASYHPFGHVSYLQMLHVKLERLKSVADQESPNYESGRDSVIDLMNYASFYVAWMDEQQPAERVESWTASGAADDLTDEEEMDTLREIPGAVEVATNSVTYEEGGT